MKTGYSLVTEYIKEGKIFTIYRSNTNPKDEIMIENEKNNKTLKKPIEKLTKINIKKDILPELIKTSLAKKGVKK